MTSVGTILRNERTAQGRTVADVARELCITQSYLHAIENDQLQSLPGTFFYKSFVRQYAGLLGLDPAKLQPKLEALVGADAPVEGAGTETTLALQASQPSSSVLRVPDPLVEAANKLDLSRRSLGLSLVALAVTLVAGSSVYAWWTERAEQEPRAVAQPVLTGQIPSPAPVAASEPAADGSPATTASEGPSLDVTTSTSADGTHRVVLNLSATEQTWLSITSDGERVFSGVLEPSETKTLTGSEIARMRVGNAGGLQILWNGKQIGPIGESGQVRIVEFTPDEFQIRKPPRRDANSRDAL